MRRKKFKGMSQLNHENVQPTKRSMWLRRWSGILTLTVALIIIGVALIGSLYPTSAHQSTVATTTFTVASQQARLQMQMTQNQQTVVDKQTSVSLLSNNAQLCTDPGMTDDTNTAAGNIDGGGRSYSMNAWQKTHMQSSFVAGNLQFDWYNSIYTDCISNGQVLPITTSTTSDVALGLIGSANNGPVAGNAIITYEDGTTQSFQLGLSDWTLGGGTQTPSYGNEILSAQTYRNTRLGQQNIKTFLFLTKVALQSGKKAISVTMPKLTGAAQLHVFAWSTANSNAADLYNNVASTDDAYTKPGNFDHVGNSYSATAEWWSPSGLMDANDSSLNGFRAPVALGGTFNSYEAAGQTIPLNAQGKSFEAVRFVGAASNGPSYGTAYVNYTDGTRQSFILGFSDWTLNGGKQAPSYSNQLFSSFKYRNTQSGQQNIPTFLFKASTKVQADKIVQSVTLPASTNQGLIHVFSLAFDDTIGANVGSTSDSTPLFGNLDGGNRSYSEDALVQAHIFMSPPTGVEHAFSFNGSISAWSASYNYSTNNFIADGQVMPYGGDSLYKTHITFIGAATGGTSSGTGTILYTDGSTGTYSLRLTDWCASTVESGNLVVATLPYRNTAFGRQSITNRVFYAEAPVDATKTVQSITFPKTTGGQMHIFHYGYRYAPYNNIGGDLDVDSQDINNFDGQNSGYSYDALGVGGLVKGPVTVNGVQFDWHNVLYSHADNYQASGQVIPVTPVSNAKYLAFLGASANGSSSGTATIAYTDGTKQTFTLGFTDWCSSTISFSNRLVATGAYRLTPTGKQMIKTFVFYADVALQPGKTVQSVTLPNNGHIHVFTVATK